MMKNKFAANRNTYVFNTPMEVGLRALIILNELSPSLIDLNRLVIYDYLVTHSSDVDNNVESLHPLIPNRSGEIIIKRKVMQEGINLMYSKDLLEIVYTKDGLSYRANDLSKYFINYLDSAYAREVRGYSQWLNETFSHFSDKELEEYINKNIYKWGSEFTKESLVRGGFDE
ncbi:MAG: ABC-three component system middle component 2 [Bacillota bacterium]